MGRAMPAIAAEVRNMAHKDSQAHSDLRGGGHPRTSVSMATRLRARALAGRLDRQVESGMVAEPGSPLALHTARLTSAHERERLARALRHAAAQAHRQPCGIPVHVAVDDRRITLCRDVIDEITLLLHSPRPVHARGMARLRNLLSDGGGPLYRHGSGSLAAQLRGVLAAL